MSAPQQGPSLSHTTFAKLSPGPYLLAHLTQSPSIRANGRIPSQTRRPHINNSSLTHAEGSAVVRCGDTTVVCGVRAEILLASDAPNYRALTTSPTEAQDLDLLVPNIELATGCSPAFLPGMPPSTLAQSLSTRIYGLLHSSGLVEGEGLRIYDEERDGDGEVRRVVRGFWCLYIDILYISLDGNAFDVAWAAVVSALRDVRLPDAVWDLDQEGIVCSDEVDRSRRLVLRGLPIASTYVVFGEGMRKGDKHWILADPDMFEESLCSESITVVVDCTDGGTKILGLSKAGGSVVGKEEMSVLLELGSKRWLEWKEVMDV